ncbi:MAG: hypothetical protein LBJ02_12100 [Bifidobacteriaceae bacterium]|nr:hypothetical protein [Bifidobacteriaceae bacterium]
MAVSRETEELLRGKFADAFPRLDRRSARLVAAADAWSLGYGGIAAVARASGLSRAELVKGLVELGVRPGGEPD